MVFNQTVIFCLPHNLSDLLALSYAIDISHTYYGNEYATPVEISGFKILDIDSGVPYLFESCLRIKLSPVVSRAATT